LQHLDADTQLVVPTPERVSFEYRLAGPGSRFVAQAIDLLILAGVLMVVLFAVVTLALVTGDGRLAALIFVLTAFVLVFGYFWFFEALWTGQTVGKRVMNLRVVGDRGEPLTFPQAAIRNLVRIVDFAPSAYGLGLAVLFINGRGKRLGDLAAGTVVVREGATVSLAQLVRAAPPPAPAPPLPEAALRHLEPELRRFVVAYAARRPALPPPHRAHLAQIAQPALQTALPDVVGAYGPLAALDHLADQTTGPAGPTGPTGPVPPL
jgi:uncharacterized RDD family membrane protein YckC